jgi:hypothetical protein
MSSPMPAGETASEKAVCVQSVSQPWSTFERVVKGHLVSEPHSPSSRVEAGLRTCRVGKELPGGRRRGRHSVLGSNGLNRK